MAEANSPSTGQTVLACDLCENTDINNDVTWYCNDCKASLCGKCKKEHLEGKPTIFNRHKIVPRVEALKSRLSEDEPCSIHSGSNYLFHCNTCHQLVCNHCIIEEHNGHDFCKIEDAMETVRQDIKQYSDIIQDTLLAECVAMESIITENDKRCDDFYAIKESNVQKKRGKLISEVNRLCDDVLQSITNEKMQNRCTIDQEKLAVQTKIQDIKKLLDTKTEVMKKSNSEMIQFLRDKPAIASIRLPAVSPLKLESLTDEQLEGLRVVQSCPKTDNTKIAYTGDNEVPHKATTTLGDNPVKQLRTTDDNRLKQPRTTYDNRVKQPRTTYDKIKQPTTTDDNKIKQPVTTDDKTINQPMTTDDKDNNKEPKSAEASVVDVQIISRYKYDTGIYNITSVDEDKVWSSGCNSKKMSLVNTKGETLKQITTKLTVDNFTILPSGDFITSHCRNQCIQVMSESGQVTRTIHTHPDYPQGVCLTNDRRDIAVCLCSPDSTSKLAVFGLDGQRKETFQYTDMSLLLFLNNNQRVTTNQSGDYCVAHSELRAVFVVSQSGTLKFTYHGSNATPQTGTFLPFDITCDKYNNLLISDTGNNTIHMVDQQGKFLRYLLTSEHGVVEPRGLSLDKDGKLWVGLWNGTMLVVKYLQSS